MHARRFGSAIVRGDSNEDVFRGGLGILDDNIKVTVFVEDAGIEQLKFGVLFRTAPIFLEQLSIGLSARRIFVKNFHVGVRGVVVRMEVIFFHILALFAFVAGLAKERFV